MRALSAVILASAALAVGCTNAGGCDTNADCPAGEYCAGACGADGACTPIPEEVCADVETTYCGCDGVTRVSPSACIYDRVQSMGACDCNVTGCAEGSTCQDCLGSPACVPDGAIC